MSLYIGNLSARTRRDELEYLFRAFGHCNVQLKKDGYGFVVFDHPSDAEKALRALQGRNICGEPLTLTWSNKQPKPLRPFATGARSYESKHGRNAARVGDYGSRRMGSNGWRDYRKVIKQPEGSGRRLNSADMLDDEIGYHRHIAKDYIEEEHQGLLDEGRAVVANLDNDRWAGHVLEPQNDKGFENGIGFDRYEPCQSYDEKGENENQRMGNTGGSPATRTSQENLVGDQIGAASLDYPDSKPWQTCYSCGDSGHKIRNCPRKHALQRKPTKFDLMQDYDIDKSGRGKGEVVRFGSKSWEKLRSNRNTMSVRQQRDDRRASGSRNHWRTMKNLTEETEEYWREDYRQKKRRERGTPTGNTAKKVRRSISSSRHSDYTASMSHSTFQSSKSVPKSSRSRSTSSRARSLSSNLSSSKSHYSGPRSCKSRSRSSQPTSMSLSVSLGQPLPTSPSKVQLNPKGSLHKATTESKDLLVDQVEPVDGDERLENAKLENAGIAVYNEDVPSSSKVEDDMEKDQPLEREENDNHIMSGPLYEVTNPSTPLSEKGALTTWNSSLENLGEMMELQNSGTLEMEHMQAPTKKPDSETLDTSRTGYSTSISSEEMYRVLKHYGLEPSEENERHLSVEAFFGSARLWPWEIIYYRRLKKGPISLENYARRVVQNEEFGIVDKYIRSSSGWGEMDKENS